MAQLLPAEEMIHDREARALIQASRGESNDQRPHSPFGYPTPAELTARPVGSGRRKGSLRPQMEEKAVELSL